jgi:hypothetical protein
MEKRCMRGFTKEMKNKNLHGHSDGIYESVEK